MPKHCILFLTIAYVTSCISLFAQDPQQITVRVMAVGSSELPERYFATKGKERLTQVNWSKRQPSKTVHAMYQGTLSLFRVDISEDGKTVPTVAHRVNIPAGAKEIILFGWLNKDKINLHAIEDNYRTAKFNEWLLINLSSKRIDFLVGRHTDPVRLNSGVFRHYPIKVEENKGGSVLGKANIRGEERIFYSAFLPVSANRRTIVIFTNDGDKIRTTPIVDHFNRREKEPQDE